KNRSNRSVSTRFSSVNESRRGSGAPVGRSSQIDQNPPVDDSCREGAEPKLGIEQRPSGAKVELPAMPGARKGRGGVVERQLARAFGRQTGAQYPLTHRSALVHAQIVQRKDPVAPADDADLPRPDIDDPHLLRRKGLDRADIDAHASTIRGAG